jgi:hypothetical protein
MKKILASVLMILSLATLNCFAKKIDDYPIESSPSGAVWVTTFIPGVTTKRANFASILSANAAVTGTYYFVNIGADTNSVTGTIYFGTYPGATGEGIVLVATTNGILSPFVHLIVSKNTGSSTGLLIENSAKDPTDSGLRVLMGDDDTVAIRVDRGIVSTNGSIWVAGNVTANKYFGDGGSLTGISGISDAVTTNFYGNVTINGQVTMNSLPDWVVSGNYTWSEYASGGTTGNLVFGRTDVTTEEALYYEVNSLSPLTHRALSIVHDGTVGNAQTIYIINSGTDVADQGVRIAMGGSQATALSVVEGKTLLGYTTITGMLTVNGTVTLNQLNFPDGTVMTTAVSAETYLVTAGADTRYYTITNSSVITNNYYGDVTVNGRVTMDSLPDWVVSANYTFNSSVQDNNLIFARNSGVNINSLYLNVSNNSGLGKGLYIDFIDNAAGSTRALHVTNSGSEDGDTAVLVTAGASNATALQVSTLHCRSLPEEQTFKIRLCQEHLPLMVQLH